MKIAPVFLELKKRGFPTMLVHTGQHYDANMSQTFFDELKLPKPDVSLGVGSDTPVRQTTRIMDLFEDICKKSNIDLVVVGGDVNSTLAVALAAVKQDIPIAHVESGLRSFDRTMPEETNRVVTDHISELLFTTEDSANVNLRKEGLDPSKIRFVGNCMVDSLMKHLDFALENSPWKRFRLKPESYGLLTLHRPSNVDHIEALSGLMDVMNEVSTRLPILFPVHPRTRKRLSHESIKLKPSVHLCEPLSYPVFLGLMAKAKLVVTDSGGIQEETTVLKIPCLTLRTNTERPITIEKGTNRLVGTDPDEIYRSIDVILAGDWPVGDIPPLWDGHTAERVVDIIESWQMGRMD